MILMTLATEPHPARAAISEGYLDQLVKPVSGVLRSRRLKRSYKRYWKVKMKQECKSLKNYLSLILSDQIKAGEDVVIVKFRYVNQAFVGPNGTLRTQHNVNYYTRIR